MGNQNPGLLLIDRQKLLHQQCCLDSILEQRKIFIHLILSLCSVKWDSFEDLKTHLCKRNSIRLHSTHWYRFYVVSWSQCCLFQPRNQKMCLRKIHPSTVACRWCKLKMKQYWSVYTTFEILPFEMSKIKQIKKKKLDVKDGSNKVYTKSYTKDVII